MIGTHSLSILCTFSQKHFELHLFSLFYTVSDRNLWNTQLTKFTLVPYHSSSVYTWYVGYSRRLNTYLVPGTRLDTLFCLICRTIRWDILLYCYISYYTRRKQDLQAVSWLPEAAVGSNRARNLAACLAPRPLTGTALGLWLGTGDLWGRRAVVKEEIPFLNKGLIVP